MLSTMRSSILEVVLVVLRDLIEDVRNRPSVNFMMFAL